MLERPCELLEWMKLGRLCGDGLINPLFPAHELGQYISQPRDKNAALQLASSFARIKTHLRCWWTRAGDEIEWPQEQIFDPRSWWPFLPTLQAVVVEGNQGRGGDVENGAVIEP
jgi:hypothetical protein